jgi:heme-degrading monooxygenase HmoA
MITLNMRLTANPGREAELSSAIRDRWMKAMSRQPGFIRGVMLKPYEGEIAAQIGLPEQDFTFEVVSFWESEEQRATWAASDIHAEVIAYVNDALLPETGKNAAMFTIEEQWEA